MQQDYIDTTDYYLEYANGITDFGQIEIRIDSNGHRDFFVSVAEGKEVPDDYYPNAREYHHLVLKHKHKNTRICYVSNEYDMDWDEKISVDGGKWVGWGGFVHEGIVEDFLQFDDDFVDAIAEFAQS